MKAQDQMVTVQLHRSDFNEENWNYFKASTYWFHTVFVGERIIRVVTWESNYDSIQERYNFN